MEMRIKGILVDKKFNELLKKYEKLEKYCDKLEFEIFELNKKLNVKLDCIGIPPGKGKISVP